MRQRSLASVAPAPGTPHPPEQVLATLLAMQHELPRMPQQARSRERYAALLQAAARLFVERGYAAITADDIAAAAEVSVGTFYNYFHNKRQILLKLVIDRVDMIFANLQLAHLDVTQGHEREAIRAAIHAVLSADVQLTDASLSADPPHRPRPDLGLRRVWAELLSVEPQFLPYQQGIRDYIVTQLAERLHRLAANPLARQDLDIPAVALAIVTMLEGLTLRHDAQVTDQRLVEAVTDIIVCTLFSSPAR